MTAEHDLLGEGQKNIISVSLSFSSLLKKICLLPAVFVSSGHWYEWRTMEDHLKKRGNIFTFGGETMTPWK